MRLPSREHDLRLRPARGAVFNLRITTRTEVSFADGDEKTHMGDESAIGYEWSVADTTSEDVTVFRVTITSIRLEEPDLMGTKKYDSSRRILPAESASGLTISDPFAEFCDALLGRSFVVKVGASGESVVVEGIDEILSQAAEEPPDLLTLGRPETVPKAPFKAAMEMTKYVAMGVPPRRVRVGDSWNRPPSTDSFLHARTTLTLRGVSGGVADIELRGELRAKEGHSFTGLTGFNGAGRASGSIRLDVDTGMPARLDVEMTISGTVDPEFLADERPMPFSTRNRIVLEILDQPVEFHTLAAPTDAYDEAISRAIKYKNGKEFDLAIAEYKRAIEMFPEGEAAYGGLGTTYRKMGEYDLAVEAFTESLKREYEFHNYYQRGLVYQLKGDLDNAIADFTRAIEGRRVYGPAYEERGVCYRWRGDHEKALKDFDRAIMLGDSSVYPKRAALYAEMGRLDEALVDHDWFVRDPCCSKHKYVARGLFFLYDARDVDRAIADLRAWTELAPGDSYGALWLSVAMEMKRQDGIAKLRGLDAGLDQDEWPYPVVQMFMGSTTPEQLLASAVGRTKRETNERKCVVHFYVGKWYALQQDEEKARAHFQHCLETGVRDHFQYDAARHELRMLRTSSP